MCEQIIQLFKCDDTYQVIAGKRCPYGEELKYSDEEALLCIEPIPGLSQKKRVLRTYPEWCGKPHCAIYLWGADPGSCKIDGCTARTDPGPKNVTCDEHNNKRPAHTIVDVATGEDGLKTIVGIECHYNDYGEWKKKIQVVQDGKGYWWFPRKSPHRDILLRFR